MEVDELIADIKKRVHLGDDTTFDHDIEKCIDDSKNYIKYMMIGKGVKEDAITDDFWNNDMIIQAIKDIATSYFIINMNPGEQEQSNSFFARGQNTLDVYGKVVIKQLRLKRIERIDSGTFATKVPEEE